MKSEKGFTMFNRSTFIKKLGFLGFFLGFLLWAWRAFFGSEPEAGANTRKSQEMSNGGNMPEKVVKSEEKWREQLTPEQFKVMREKGTEPPFTSAYNNFKGNGIYQCAGCRLDLFGSEEKFDSGTGWPSFWAPIAKNNVTTLPDNSLFMKRTEVLCSRCDAHLGHVFEDGPPPTGLRYCINGVTLLFSENKQK